MPGLISKVFKSNWLGLLVCMYLEFGFNQVTWSRNKLEVRRPRLKYCLKLFDFRNSFCNHWIQTYNFCYQTFLIPKNLRTPFTIFYVPRTPLVRGWINKQTYKTNNHSKFCFYFSLLYHFNFERKCLLIYKIFEKNLLSFKESFNTTKSSPREKMGLHSYFI